jgi:hypothetical protein
VCLQRARDMLCATHTSHRATERHIHHAETHTGHKNHGLEASVCRVARPTCHCECNQAQLSTQKVIEKRSVGTLRQNRQAKLVRGWCCRHSFVVHVTEHCSQPLLHDNAEDCHKTTTCTELVATRSCEPRLEKNMRCDMNSASHHGVTC